MPPQSSTQATTAKAALVTGASRGIGRAIALRLAADGYAVVVNYAGNAASADAVVAQIEANGGQAIAAQGDVADPADMQRVFELAQQTYGRLDAVVNSAGVMPYVPIAGGDLGEFDRVIHTNLRGSFIVLGLAAQHLSDGGRIVALSTSVIGKAFPNYGPYIASKAGVEGLVHVLANELRGRNITVNAVAPGPVGTELFFNGKTEEQIAHFVSLAPLERLGQPEEIASAVAFLTGPDGSWVNSQVLRVNGGYVF
ncbi:putative short-chain dehydrogenase [Lysobacter capsici AZ78]|uniref:Short-chain dehydrogenase n=1 Tax=Lysobacter capsici AZ78 TaxID=1444315 RepID=A0A108U4Z1_9GAMM|nr:SDR family oxidoreductase [Lysobacter capsici]KWS02637.1 putative short-chain dehydrogenase [Lysobacter capsici AZ78]